MINKKYVRPSAEIVEIETNDVIATSGLRNIYRSRVSFELPTLDDLSSIFGDIV